MKRRNKLKHQSLKLQVEEEEREDQLLNCCDFIQSHVTQQFPSNEIFIQKISMLVQILILSEQKKIFQPEQQQQQQQVIVVTKDLIEVAMFGRKVFDLIVSQFISDDTKGSKRFLLSVMTRIFTEISKPLIENSLVQKGLVTVLKYGGEAMDYMDWMDKFIELVSIILLKVKTNQDLIPVFCSVDQDNVRNFQENLIEIS
jgi:hypothetical protein